MQLRFVDIYQQKELRFIVNKDETEWLFHSNLTKHLTSTLCNVKSSPMKMALTHYQTTNFRLFQTKRICSGQFQI